MTSIDEIKGSAPRTEPSSSLATKLGSSLNKTQEINMQMLRNYEGLGATVKFAMELQCAKRVGRMPFLQSSKAQLDTLTGNDELIDFCDILGGKEFCEIANQPHALMEKLDHMI